tara:strand:- start:11734 stop:13248 length:1515 start_codon:yes stop_codon:yes gene_type:complete
MGIPIYYKELIQNYPDIIQYPSENKNLCINNLFFDLNCAIHPCCANKTNEQEMFQEILKKINECIKITNVKDLIYIAIDGPAPRTKMEQQRQRRLKSSQENKLWDTNQITPGTPFMKQLNTFLQNYCDNSNIKIILSNSDEPGEGEHKIMKYMDQHIDKNSINAVYGLDADLIMLSMIRKHTVYLLRERTAFNLEKTEEPYIFLNIDLLKYHLIDSIFEPFYKLEKEMLLVDYLFLCFFIGNDFIINTPSINIRYNGLTILINTYKKLQKDYSGRFFIINDTMTINISNLKIYLHELSKLEQSNLDTILSIRNKKSMFYKKKFNHILKEHSIHSIEQLDNLSPKDLNISQEDYDSIHYVSPLLFRIDEKNILSTKNKYYTYTLYQTEHYNPSFDLLLKKDITNLCKEYFKAIQWTFSYYFKDCLSWRWYYQYHSAPLITDLYQYISTLEDNDVIHFENDEPYTPKEQLSIVLPCLKDSYMYPRKTPLFSLMKNYYWECHPLLPH